jgi:uncharacterized protein (UPF0276 family)
VDAARSDRHLGLGIGWRPELALAISRRADLGFVEIVAEHVPAAGPLPPAVQQLISRGVQVVPHGISLSLGSADRPDPARLNHLASVARRAGSPLVSEHVAFVRANGVEAGHLLPVPRTREMLAILVENVKIAIDAIGLPLALENISALFEWPGAEMDEVSFIGELLDRTGALLLLDLSNVHANAKNLGWDPMRFLTALPLDRLAYCHIGGGTEAAGVYHDTHADAAPAEAIELLRALSARITIPGAMLERDDNFPPETELNGELNQIRQAMLPSKAGHV